MSKRSYLRSTYSACWFQCVSLTLPKPGWGVKLCNQRFQLDWLRCCGGSLESSNPSSDYCLFFLLSLCACMCVRDCVHTCVCEGKSRGGCSLEWSLMEKHRIECWPVPTIRAAVASIRCGLDEGGALDIFFPSSSSSSFFPPLFTLSNSHSSNCNLADYTMLPAGDVWYPAWICRGLSVTAVVFHTRSESSARFEVGRVNSASRFMTKINVQTHWEMSLRVSESSQCDKLDYCLCTFLKKPLCVYCAIDVSTTTTLRGWKTGGLGGGLSSCLGKCLVIPGHWWQAATEQRW